MSIRQFSFDIELDIFYNVQVRRWCWSGNRFQIVSSLIFLKLPGSMDWGIIILEKILIVRKCLAITGQMLSSKIVSYFPELMFPVIHVNVPSVYQQMHPISLLDILCPVLMESSQVYAMLLTSCLFVYL